MKGHIYLIKGLKVRKEPYDDLLHRELIIAFARLEGATVVDLENRLPETTPQKKEKPT